MAPVIAFTPHSPEHAHRPDAGQRSASWAWRPNGGFFVSSANDEEASMKRLASSLLVSTGLLVLMLAFSASNTQAVGGPGVSSPVELDATTAAQDHVVLERRFESTRGPCTPDLGVPTNRVFPDGTREFFVVPAGKAFVLTDLEGEITERLGATWFTGTIGYLNATLTGTAANQYVRARAPLNAEAVSAGIATMKLHLESGAVADSGAAVCLSAIVVEKNGFRSANVGTDVRVYGYLIAH
jgi:hypothetical protein